LSEVKVKKWDSSQNEISIYQGELTPIHVLKEIARTKISFPSLPDSFFDILRDRIEDNNFTDQRLTDAVNNVIDNCVYPIPTIANFITFDRRIKLYTYSQYCKLADEGDGKNYLPVKVGNNTKPVWAHINDINEYKLEKWEK
jgi:hypothetical protein